MKTQIKYLFIIIFILILSLLYINLKNSYNDNIDKTLNSTDKTEVGLNINKKSAILKGDSIVLDKEVKISEVLSIQPSTTWESRKITLKNGKTLYYELEKGNPVDSLPLTDNEISEYNLCYSEEYPVCRTDIGYVTDRLEKKLVDLLSDQAWTNVLTNCVDDFHQADNKRLLKSDLTYDEIVKGKLLDIENWIYIDKNTGRKEIIEHLNKISEWYYRNWRNSDKDNFPNSCLSSYNGGDLAQKIQDIQYDSSRPFWKQFTEVVNWKQVIYFEFPPK